MRSHDVTKKKITKLSDFQFRLFLLSLIVLIDETINKDSVRGINNITLKNISSIPIASRIYSSNM